MAKVKEEPANDPLDLDFDTLKTQKEEAEARAAEQEAKAKEAEAKAAEEAARLRAEIELANQNNQALAEQLAKTPETVPGNSGGDPAWPNWMVIPTCAKSKGIGLQPERVDHACDESDALRVFYARKGLNPSEFSATVQRLKESADVPATVAQ